jgi:uncharacterized C2H2 Zn-finger protein
VFEGPLCEINVSGGPHSPPLLIPPLMSQATNSRQLFRCDRCTKVFESQFFLSSHIQRRHPEVVVSSPKHPQYLEKLVAFLASEARLHSSSSNAPGSDSAQEIQRRIQISEQILALSRLGCESK